MDKLAIAKSLAGIATGLGVSKITNDILRNAVTINSPEDKIRAAIGSFVIGSMVASAASNHVNAQIDSAAKFLADRKSRRILKKTDKDTVIDAA